MNGLGEAARAIAEDVVTAAHRTAVPWTITAAMHGFGRAFADADPPRALAAYRHGFKVARQSGNRWWEGITGSELAGFEARHGESTTALDLLSELLAHFDRAGDVYNVARLFGWLVVVFEQLEDAETAATLYGAGGARLGSTVESVAGLQLAVDRLRTSLGSSTFDELVATGASMERREAVDDAQARITDARGRLETSP